MEEKNFTPYDKEIITKKTNTKVINTGGSNIEPIIAPNKPDKI